MTERTIKRLTSLQSRRYVGEAVLRAEDGNCCKGAADFWRTWPRQTPRKFASYDPQRRTPSCGRYERNARWQARA